MSETPTARELLDEVSIRGKSQDPMLAAMGIAIRVEAVLALKPMESDGSFAAGSAWMLEEVHRILDGKRKV